MPTRQDDHSAIVRIAVGERGCVPMGMDINLRFDYGRLVPWASKPAPDTMEFICGPHAATLHIGTETKCENGRCGAEGAYPHAKPAAAGGAGVSPEVVADTLYKAAHEHKREY